MLKTATLERIQQIANECAAEGETVTLRMEGRSLVWEASYDTLCRGIQGGTDIRNYFNSYKAWRSFFESALCDRTTIEV